MILQNLDRDVAIAKDDGTPTEFFMRLMQARGTLAGDQNDLLSSIAALNINAGAGLDGGGTIAAAVAANPSSPVITLDANANEILDLITSTRGSILYRGSSGWSGRSPGTSGYFLKSFGGGADPDWAVALLPDGDYGDITVSGSGTVLNIDSGTIGIAELSATGTPDGTTYLRGDNTWATVPAGYTDEQARDAIGTALTAGAGITVTPNDGADTITVASTITQYTDEEVRDVIGTALVAGTGISITVSDISDTITIVNTTGASGGGTWGPTVDGSFPPIFYQWPDGGLVLMEYV